MSEETANTSAMKSSEPTVGPDNLIPKTWPGGFGLYKYSKAVVRVNLLTLVGVFVFSIVLSLLQRVPKIGVPLSIIGSILTGAATTIVYLLSIKGEKISTIDALKQSPKYALNMLGLIILTNIAMVVSFILLIVPFFIVLPRISLAEYFLVDKNLNCIDAIKASWKATKGHSGKIWGVIGATIVMALPIVTILGIPVAIYLLVMYSASQVLLYKHLSDLAPAQA